MTEEFMPFATGGDDAEKAGLSGKFGNVRYFSLANPGDKAIVRMLTEQTAWPYCTQHGFIPTKSRPADLKEGTKWPESMPAICQNDKKLKQLPGYGDCYICRAPQYQKKDKNGKVIAKTSIRVWALCVLREEVKDASGKRVGLKDKLVEIEDKDGNKKLVLDIRVINMASKNFFSHWTGMYHVYGTVLDRDYVVTRKGSGIDTDYPPVPLDKVQVELKDDEGNVTFSGFHEPGSPTWDVYAKAVEEQEISLPKIMLERCSPEYFAKFFIPGEGESAAAVEDADGEPVEDTPKDPERMASIRDRIKSYKPEAETAEA